MIVGRRLGPVVAALLLAKVGERRGPVGRPADGPGSRNCTRRSCFKAPPSVLFSVSFLLDGASARRWRRGDGAGRHPYAIAATHRTNHTGRPLGVAARAFCGARCRAGRNAESTGTTAGEEGVFKKLKKERAPAGQKGHEGILADVTLARSAVWVSTTTRSRAGRISVLYCDAATRVLGYDVRTPMASSVDGLGGNEPDGVGEEM